MRKLSQIIPIKHFKRYMFLLDQDKLAGGKTTLLDVLQQHLTLDKSRIDEHYSENSAILAFWIAKAKFEEFKLKRLDRQYEKRWSNIYVQIKAGLPAKTSETEIKARLNRNEGLSELQEKIDVLTYKVGLLKAIIDVIKTRNDNVINLGANIRKELSARDSTRKDYRNG
jgi:hypothetical protein